MILRHGQPIACSRVDPAPGLCSSQDSVVWRSGGLPLRLVACSSCIRSLATPRDLENSQITGAHAIWCSPQFFPVRLSLPIRFPSLSLVFPERLHSCPLSCSSILPSVCNTALTHVSKNPLMGEACGDVRLTHSLPTMPLSPSWPLALKEPWLLKVCPRCTWDARTREAGLVCCPLR